MAKGTGDLSRLPDYAILLVQWCRMSSLRRQEALEKRHQRQAQRSIVISPMIDPHAARMARALGIEIYGFPEDVPAEQNG